MILSTVLSIDWQVIYNTLMVIVGLATFVIMYNKQAKNKVDKNDMTEMRKYIDQQDRALHHRVDGIENRIEKKLDILTEHLLGKK